MRLVPTKRVDRVQFYEDHIAAWTTNATAIGTTTTAVTDLQTKTAAARAAYDAQQLALQAAKAATDTFYTAVTVMGVAGEGILGNIRNKAVATANPNVYSLAQIPVPGVPQPRGNPGTPFDFKVSLTSTGALDVTFKNTNAASCVYNIYRKIGTSDYQFLIGVGAKRFTDATVPAGTAQVEYQVQAVRSTGVSQWAPFTVNLGVAPNGLPQATVSEQPAKAAA